MKTDETFAVCVQNKEYPASLELHKLYQVLIDTESAKHQMMRVIDESGEDYLYPADYFMIIELSKPIKEALLQAA